MVGLRRHEAQQLVEIVERIPNHVLSRLELRPTERCCQLWPSERVFQHQDPFVRAEADLDLLTLLDLLPHHHSFLTLAVSCSGSFTALLGDIHLGVLTYGAPHNSCGMEAFEHRIDFVLGVILSLEVLHKIRATHFDLATKGLQHL